jgi:hypothetical protein
VKKQIATTNNGCNTYYYGKRIGMRLDGEVEAVVFRVVFSLANLQKRTN